MHISQYVIELDVLNSGIQLVQREKISIGLDVKNIIC